MQTILIVDDDPKLLKMLQRTLAYEGLNVLVACNGLEALPIVDAHQPDLLIVDWMMPRMDGLALLRRLRDDGNKTLVLMLTARDAVENRVEGLESGADDYLVKPFAPAELVARVHALLRRGGSKEESQAVTCADVTLDPATHEARRADRDLCLTPTEFKLLHLLLRHPRQVLERGQILAEVWGYDFGGDDNVLEIYIGYLRKKLEAGGGARPSGGGARPSGGGARPSGGGARLIHTVRGVGYVFREE